MTNEVNFMVNKEMCLSFFVREDERNRHGGCNAVIENTQLAKECILTQNQPSGDFK